MPALSVRDVGYAIEGKRLLDGIDVSVDPGTLLAIVGPNGAGKSTLLRRIAGVLRGDGATYLDDAAIESMHRRARARSIAFVPADDAALDELTVRDIVAEGRHAHRRNVLDRALEHERAIARALERVGLAEFAERPFRELSSGERRRTWIALGLAQEAPILLLDEPTAHLDFRFAQQTLRLMRALVDENRSIITVLHDLNEAAQVADRILLLDGGRIARIGAPADVLTRDVVARHYGVDVDIITTQDGTIRLFARA